MAEHINQWILTPAGALFVLALFAIVTIWVLAQLALETYRLALETYRIVRYFWKGGR